MNFYQKDNFFTEQESKTIDSIIHDAHFPVFYYKNQVIGDGIPFFSHVLITKDTHEINSDYSNFFLGIAYSYISKVSKLEPKQFLRGNINLTLPFSGKPKLHVDHDEPHYQIIMYLNDASGTTDIYKGKKLFKKVSPKKGRIIMFDKQNHLANSPIGKDELRAVCVITFNTNK
tara:strand:- start:50 stop:568 length:519 start_codon:yes stop_codon:yes gene_type:complete